MEEDIKRCIACGHIEKDGDLSTCPICGHALFLEPFNRKDLLISEIKKFFNNLKPIYIEKNDLIFYREENSKIRFLEDDINRFPDLNTINKYLDSSRKTQVYLEKLEKTIFELKKYIDSTFNEEYVFYGKNTIFKEFIYYQIVKDTLEIAGISDFEYIKRDDEGEFNLKYLEYLNDNFKDISFELIDLSKELLEKINNLYKKYNLYGTSPSYEIKIREIENIGDGDIFIILNEDLNLLRETLDKKYYIDILSDGSEEIEELLSPIFQVINDLVYLPIMRGRYRIKNEKMVFQSLEDFLSYFNETLELNYSKMNEKILEYDDLLSFDEDKLFSIYEDLNSLEESYDTKPRKHSSESEDELNSMIGLNSIKENIRKIKAYMLTNKDSKANLNMAFYGNPGTGKTEVARLLSGILYENGILPENKLIEVDRSDLVGGYVGQTPIKTSQVIEKAMGGVLFIDEAYSLIPKDSPSDYGYEAIAILLKAMEDYRGEFCVIFAGYRNEMIDLLNSNPGLRSRIQFELAFPNYNREELSDILDLMLEKEEYSISEDAKEKILDITDKKRQDVNFANAREVRNILFQVIMNLNLRTMGESNTISLVDVNKYIDDFNISIKSKVNRETLTPEEELDQLIGLRNVKRTVKKIRAFVKRNKEANNLNLHMVFRGNPGTGKTEVARIMSRILYEVGSLKEAKLVETNANDFISLYVGGTGKKTEEKIREALGGVLFIDEAYSLVGEGSHSYGDEAIATLIKEMEDKRGQFVCILAGYKDEMNYLIETNPGFKSRIQFYLDFDDYNREELKEIAKKFLSDDDYTIEDDAMDLLLDISDYYREGDNFANARTIRNIIQEVIMNQNLRIEEEDSDERIIRLIDVKDYLLDNNLDLSKGNSQKRSIGFDLGN